MRSLAGGASEITVGQGRDITGMTVTSVLWLSVDPPTLIVSVNRSSSSWPLLQRYRAFGVNILGAEQLGGADKRICWTTGDCRLGAGGVVFAAKE